MRKHILIGSAIFLFMCVLCVRHVCAQGAAKVANTKHNLSASGPGPITVAGESEVCKFCHTPHSANPIAPLWNRFDPGSYYQTYESSTLAANVGQPSGSSRLCLSCHDGTIALTQVYNPRNSIQGSVYISAGDSGYVGTELTDDHPISLVYDSALTASNGQLHDPATLPPELPLDQNQLLQCATCHDAHDDTFGKFLRMDNIESAMCIECHNVDGWSSGSHATSSAPISGAQGSPWGDLPYSSVRELGCESCHRPHSAGSPERLLRYEAEEDNCSVCHDGSVASENVSGEFAKLSSHPVGQTTGVHDPTEALPVLTEHVECADCHDAHQSSPSPPASAPFIGPSMQGASGVSSAGSAVSDATYEYEVCYKCHAWGTSFASPVVDRVIQNTNTATEFSPSNASYHPVEAQGRNPDVPSLLEPYNTTSIIYCTDCHGSDASPDGPNGPHGSDYEPLLVRNYEVIENTSESPSAYALCYGCHNRSSILADEGFSRHRKHIVGKGGMMAKSTACSVCHDPHGVPDVTHLINFDRDVVFAAGNGVGPLFEDQGVRRGSCTLKCHGKDHRNKTYGP